MPSTPVSSVEWFHINHVASTTRALICLVTLTFENLVRIIVHGVSNLPTNFGVSGTFRSRLMGQHLSDAPCDLITMAFDFEGYGAACDTGLQAPTVYKVFRRPSNNAHQFQVQRLKFKVTRSANAETGNASYLPNGMPYELITDNLNPYSRQVS